MRQIETLNGIVHMAYRPPLFEQEPLVYPVVASSTFRLRSVHEGFVLCSGQVRSIQILIKSGHNDRHVEFG